MKPQEEKSARSCAPNEVDEAARESFPASDPPAWTLGRDSADGRDPACTDTPAERRSPPGASEPAGEARRYRHHFEATERIEASPPVLFDKMDDHDWLAAHMMKSSAMMAGSAMAIDTDALHGRAVGSRIAMSGRIMGFGLRLIETVTVREPPYRKAWETVEAPRLLVIGRYRMGFAIEPDAGASRLTMSIDYDDPPPPWRWLGRLLGGTYARWCTRSMARGVADFFRPAGEQPDARAADRPTQNHVEPGA